VSADQASSTASGSKSDPVRALQHTLYRSAKADPGRRFHALRVEGGRGVDFLGFHNRLVRGRTPRSAHLVFLARWPSCKAVQYARDRIRAITARSRMLLPTEHIVGELNLFLRGWAEHFRYGNSALVFGQIRNYALKRVALLMSKRGNRRHAWGWGMARVLVSPDHTGLVSLDGLVVPPRPFRAWKVECRR
jgi:Group II intron, maturase-specific domain